MRFYRKKPVIIEAFQMTEEVRANYETWPKWLRKAWKKNYGETGAVYPYSLHTPFTTPEMALDLAINTLEGTHRCQIDDWIIKGVKGELYPCKPDIFEETYEEIK